MEGIAATVQPIVEPVPVTGTLTPPRQALLSAEVAGLVSEVHVDLGHRVKKGQPLLELGPELNQIARDAALEAISHSVLRNRVLNGINWLIETPARRLYTIAVTVAASLAIVLLLTPPAEYLPEGEEAQTFATMNAPPGYNLATMEQIASELQEYFLPFVEDESAAFAARGSIISSNDAGTRSVDLDISGANLADLFKVARAAYTRAEEIFDDPSIQTRPSSLSLTQPLLQVTRIGTGLPRWA